MTKSVNIINAPPVVKLGEQKLVGNTYTAHLSAEDPEGGPVTFTINEAPSGLTVDANGNITWKVGAGVEGSFPVKISVKDEKGAESIISFTIGLRWQKSK